jgi:hypothetical protein
VTLSNGGATVTLQLSAPDIRSGDDVLITIENVTNGPSGAQNLGITTSSDTVAASAPFTLAAPRAGSQVKVTLSSATHGATGVTYTVHFATSAIGGVSALSGGTITLAGPAGTVFPMGGMPYSLLDTTTGLMSGGTGMRPQVTLSNFGATATIAFPNPDIASGDHFLVTVSGVQNAPTAGAKTLAVTTSSDTVPANGSFKLG